MKNGIFKAFIMGLICTLLLAVTTSGFILMLGYYGSFPYNWVVAPTLAGFIITFFCYLPKQ